MKFKKKNLIIASCIGCLLIAVGIVGFLFEGSGSSSCDPFNVFLSKTGDNSVKISWSTNDACLGYILYGESSYEIERVAVNTDNLEKAKEHSVEVGNLLTTNSYYFIVVSGEEPYGNDGKPIAFSLTDL